MINCNNCKYFEADYTDDGVQEHGKCNLQLPPFIQVISTKKVWPSDGCSFGVSNVAEVNSHFLEGLIPIESNLSIKMLCDEDCGRGDVSDQEERTARLEETLEELKNG